MFTTFVINLDKDTERMDFMAAQLRRLGMDYVRHPAVYGKTYTPTKSEYDPELARKKGGHELLPGEVGCALSHAQVIERVVREGLPYAVILEDDVTLPADFRDIIERMIKEDRGTWEYLLFDYIPVGVPFLKIWLSGITWRYKNTQGMISRIKFIAHHFLKAAYVVPLSIFEGLREVWKRKNPGPVRFFRPVYFAGAYLVTQSGARKLHELSHPVIYTADHLPNRARRRKGLKFRGYCPLVVRQEKEVFGSSILNLSGKEVHLSYVEY